MGKRKNKNKLNIDKTKVIENSLASSKLKEEKQETSKYFIELNSNIKTTQDKLDAKNSIKNDVKAYLNEDHMLYENIKENAFNIQKNVLNYSRKPINVEEKSEYIFFDFENNSYLANDVHIMSECYLSDSGNIHLCKQNGLYIGKEHYSSSSLFLADKKQINSNRNYISSFGRILDSIVSNTESNKKYPYFCMLPETIDVFNTKVRSCLNTSKGKIISIPKSIAITYFFLDELAYGDRYCVVDLDGIHPVATQLSIGKDENGNKVILREGFFKKYDIKYTYLKFASEYIRRYELKYSIIFLESEKISLINNKKLAKLFKSKETIYLFRNDGRVDVIFDKDIYEKCFKEYLTTNCLFPNCTRTYVVSELQGLVKGDTIFEVDNSVSFKGLKLIRKKLLNDENAIIWKERLPKISLEVIDDTVGRFKIVNLVDENSEGQDIRLSVDEEIELPFRGTITLQKGKKDYYLPLEREIYSEDVNGAKEAHFKDKSFPLERDIPVELIVKYNYMSETPIKLYARPKTKICEFQEISNTWVDPHEIEVYSGPIYNGHEKGIVQLKSDDIFSRIYKNFDRFLSGYTRFNETSWVNDPTGERFHKDYIGFIWSYRQIRMLFDSENVKEDLFKKLYNQYNLNRFFEKYVELLDNADSTNYDREDVKKYLKGIRRPVSDFVVACWYFDRDNKNVKRVYKYIASQKDEVESLCRLSRCINNLQDDIYDIYDNLSEQIYEEILKSKSKGIGFASKHASITSYVRGLSSNCWFNKDWIFNFYNSSKGKECILEIINFTYDFLSGGDYGRTKKFRDILEFLVCISRLREIDQTILNPNDEKTKEILFILKNSYLDFEKSLGQEKLVSRLITNTSQGPLFGYPNYIYMLIMTLSGEGQVNLVGYHDE